MKILAKPGLESDFNQATSPQCLYKALINEYDANVSIVEWSPLRMFFSNYDILHLHWPDNILGSRFSVIIVMKILLLTVALKIVKYKGSKVIWTSHNIKSHYVVSEKLQDFFWNQFLKHVDGIVAPSKKIKEELLTLHPISQNIPVKVLYFGGWDGVVPNNVNINEARSFIGVAKSEFLIIWVGAIRRYKGLDNLIKSFSEIKDSQLRLLIAGMIFDPGYEKEIKLLSEKDERIMLRSGFVPNNELQYYYNAADLAVFPFRHVTNSGSVRLALHFNCPVLVPDFPIFNEMNQEFGDHFVRVYPKEGGKLSGYIESTVEISKNNKRSEFDWGEWDWDVSAKKYYTFCSKIINKIVH